MGYVILLCILAKYATGNERCSDIIVSVGNRGFRRLHRRSWYGNLISLWELSFCAFSAGIGYQCNVLCSYYSFSLFSGSEQGVRLSLSITIVQRWRSLLLFLSNRLLTAPSTTFRMPSADKCSPSAPLKGTVSTISLNSVPAISASSSSSARR